MRRSYARLLIALLGGAFALTAWAQVLRNIPPDAKRAELTHIRGNIVQLDDKQLRLAPGALIRDQGNIIVLPTMVPTKAPVRYQLDSQGMLSRAWILTPQEAAQEQPAPKPTPVKPGADKDDDTSKSQ